MPAKKGGHRSTPKTYAPPKKSSTAGRGTKAGTAKKPYREAAQTTAAVKGTKATSRRTRERHGQAKDPTGKWGGAREEYGRSSKEAATKLAPKVAGRVVKAAGKAALPLAVAADVGERNKAAFKRKYGRVPKTPYERMEARYGVDMAPEKAPKRMVTVRKPVKKAASTTRGRKR